MSILFVFKLLSTIVKYSQKPTTKFKHFSSTSKYFQAPLSALRTFKGLEFGSVKFKDPELADDDERLSVTDLSVTDLTVTDL